MEGPARKRRKTASPDTDGRPSSPLKQPPRRPSFAHTAAGPDRPSSPLKAPPRRPSVSPTKAAFDRASSPLRKPPRRPSFASPTKASLARNYPSLLPQPRPSSSGSAVAGQNGYGHIHAKGREARAYILGDKDTQSSSRQETENGEDHSHAIAAAEQARTQESQNVTPRAQRTGTYKKAITNGGIIRNDDADLPMTPSQRALEEHDTPRRGILYSSPSKRPQKLKSMAKQSPLRPKAAPVQQNESEMLPDGPVENGEAEVENKKTREPPNSELEQRRREKNRLAKELKDLENQVSRCTEEIGKIGAQSATHVLTPAEREDLIAFINKIGKTGSDAKEEQTPSISSLLCSFLPFSTRVVPPPKSGQPQQKPVASHRPLELDDPLPYLEMFTDFKITTQLNLLPGRVSQSSNRVHQMHIIDITGPQKLLTASISVVIDILTNTIIDLEIQKLSSWAERELGMYMRKKAQEQDLGNASWAMGSYWEISRKRAEYWHRCETSFARLIPGRTSNDRENAPQTSTGKTVARKDINRHLGRDVLVLEDQHVVMKISWKIGFDWTGEAESDIGVKAAVPEVWTEADSDNSFRKIPETFNSLLQSKGAFAATKTMIALIFAE
ncbi:hypothetical protein CC80DRAFT_405926 [Byssothecium circinans]|uniref:Uncharacterized protein n=1 Tax=Byssothecium circinans TaxID=147558 RepID=A0A6A5U513_9PLEO|nr:hypothetical protein CC80DRAFT_405926 [Byssothecium circinans]